MGKLTGNPNGRPSKYQHAEDMQKIIDDYFQDCDEREVPYTIEGLACALDMDRHSINNYLKKDEFFTTLKKAKAKILARLMEISMGGKANPATVLFNLKNNYNYADRTEVKQDVTGTMDITHKVVWE